MRSNGKRGGLITPGALNGPKQEGLTIIWNSTAPWGASSYSVLTARTVPELVRMGHRIHINSWYGLQGAPQKWPIRARGDKLGAPIGEAITYPSIDGNRYGGDTLLGLYEFTKADCLITCMDIWVLPAALTKNMRFVAWLPVDHDPVPQAVIDALLPCIYPISFSQWGQMVLAKAGIKAHYIPPSASVENFYPDPMVQSRAHLGVPEQCDFLISMVAANKDPSDRKGFGEGITAFARFLESHPNAMLYVHTNWNGPVNIKALADSLNLRNKVLRPEPLPFILGMFNETYMRMVYSASDVLLNPAKSEGFGLPLVEAQMCGCPIAASDFSTTDELLFAGWKIKGQQHWSIGADSWRLLVNIDSVVEALEAAYEARGDEILRRRAREGAREFNTEHVANKFWRPAMDEITELVRGGSQNKLELVTFQ